MNQKNENVTGVDLFEDYEDMPEIVRAILNRFEDSFVDGNYSGLLEAHNNLEKIGYTFEFYLDGIAYDLRKIGEIGKVEADRLNNQLPDPPSEIYLEI